MPGTAISGAIFDTTEKNLARERSRRLHVLGPDRHRYVIRGAELEVITRVTPDLDLIGAYSYLNAMVESGDKCRQARRNRSRASGLAMGEVPAHRDRAGAGRHGRRRRALYRRGPGTATDSIRTPDYTLFDAMIRYETGPWRFPGQRRATLPTSGTCHHLPCPRRLFFGMGRTVLGSATYRF